VNRLRLPRLELPRVRRSQSLARWRAGAVIGAGAIAGCTPDRFSQTSMQHVRRLHHAVINNVRATNVHSNQQRCDVDSCARLHGGPVLRGPTSRRTSLTAGTHHHRHRQSHVTVDPPALPIACCSSRLSRRHSKNPTTRKEGAGLGQATIALTSRHQLPTRLHTSFEKPARQRGSADFSAESGLAH